MLKKRAFFFIFLIASLMVFSVGVFAAPNAFVEKGSGSAGLNFTYLMKLKAEGSGGENINVPAYGLSLRYAPFNRLAIGFNLTKYGIVNDFVRTNIHLQYMFEKPFFTDAWASIKVGYSERRYLGADLSLFGGCAGFSLSRNFKEPWWAHTSVEVEIYRNLIAPAYSVGFEYFLRPKVSLGIFFDGIFDLDGHQHGPSLTAKFHF